MCNIIKKNWMRTFSFIVMVAVLVTTMVSAPIYKSVYAETQTMSTITAETEKSSVSESIFKTANYYASQESLSEWQIPAMVRTGKCRLSAGSAAASRSAFPAQKLCAAVHCKNQRL